MRSFTAEDMTTDRPENISESDWADLYDAHASLRDLRDPIFLAMTAHRAVPGVFPAAGVADATLNEAVARAHQFIVPGTPFRDAWVVSKDGVLVVPR